MDSTTPVNMSKFILCHIPENKDLGTVENDEWPATALQLTDKVRETLLAMPNVRQAYDSAKEREALNPTEEKLLAEVPLSNTYVRQTKGPCSFEYHEVAKVQFRTDLEESSKVLVFWKLVDVPAKTGGRGRKRRNVVVSQRVVVERSTVSETDDTAKRTRYSEIFAAGNFEDVDKLQKTGRPSNDGEVAEDFQKGVTERADLVEGATHMKAAVSQIIKMVQLLYETVRRVNEVSGSQKKLVADYDRTHKLIENMTIELNNKAHETDVLKAQLRESRADADQLRLDLEHFKEDSSRRLAQSEENIKMLVSEVKKLHELMDKNQ